MVGEAVRICGAEAAGVTKRNRFIIDRNRQPVSASPGAFHDH
jgi:hypothetical protein